MKKILTVLLLTFAVLGTSAQEKNNAKGGRKSCCATDSTKVAAKECKRDSKTCKHDSKECKLNKKGNKKVKSKKA